MGEQTAETELEPFRQLRYRCPHCRKSFSNKTYARRHITEWCQKREANHACTTCAHFSPPDYDFLTDRYEAPHCGEGEDVEARLRVHCLKWGAIY